MIKIAHTVTVYGSVAAILYSKLKALDGKKIQIPIDKTV